LYEYIFSKPDGGWRLFYVPDSWFKVPGFPKSLTAFSLKAFCLLTAHYSLFRHDIQHAHILKPMTIISLENLNFYLHKIHLDRVLPD
jgi:hypothetical protein